MMIRSSYLAVVAAGSLLFALNSAANAHSSGAGGLGGGGGQPSSPPGFNNGGNHGGFDTNATGSPPFASPKGWDQGKADWKTPDSTATPPAPDTTLPPGFSKN